MKHIPKRLLALFLVVAMCVSVMSLTVFATDSESGDSDSCCSTDVVEDADDCCGEETDSGGVTALAGSTTHGGLKVSSESAEGNAIALTVGESAVIAIEPYAHLQYQGCSDPTCPGDCSTACEFTSGLGCACNTNPALREAEVTVTVADQSVVTYGGASADGDTETLELGQTMNGSLTLTAVGEGTTTVTVTATLKDWESVETTFAVTVAAGETSGNESGEASGDDAGETSGDESGTTESGLLESDHPYADETDESVTYTLEGAVNGVYVTFDEQTCTEDGYDYITIYDGNGDEVGTYTGSALAGATVYISTATFTIRLTSDEMVNDWGYSVTDVRAADADDVIPLTYGGTLTVDSQIWTSTEPGVTVTLGGKTLEEGTDYTYSYVRNTEDGDVPANNTRTAGDYTLTVEGIGSYSGSLSAAFTAYDRNESYTYTQADEGRSQDHVNAGYLGDSSIGCDDADEENVIYLLVGDSAEVTISPYFHVQYKGCPSPMCSNEFCGEGCWDEELGCTMPSTPTVRTATVTVDVEDEDCVSASDIVGITRAQAAELELGDKADTTFTLTGTQAGTTTVTVYTKLYDWTEAEMTYTVVVEDEGELPHSQHPYADDADESVTYTLEGAANGVYVTFDPQTATESGYDYIYIYDGNDNLVGQYTGSALSGATVYISTATFTIRLTSDYMVNDWGYRVVDVTAAGADDVIPFDYGGTLTVDSQIWTSTEPGVTVTVGGIELEEGTDYTYSYVRNTEDGDVPADNTRTAGDYTLTVEGIGSYSGTLSATFTAYSRNEQYTYTQADEGRSQDHVNAGYLGDSSISCSDTDEDNVIYLLVGDSAEVTIYPYFHVQYKGCASPMCSNEFCGEGCWDEELGCTMPSTPTVRTATVTVDVEDDTVVSASDIVGITRAQAAELELGDKEATTLTLTGASAGTTTVTVYTKLYDWTEAEATYTIVVADEGDLPHSQHNYANDTDESVTYTLAGAENGVFVTFDPQTYIEDGWDYIYIYDGEGNLVGQYTGNALAGVSVYIQTDTFTINLVSDSSVNYWGYRVVDVTAAGPDDTIDLAANGAILNCPEEVSVTRAPVISVTCGGKALEEGTDYEVSWILNTEDGSAVLNDNSQFGEYTLTVTGIGRYTGSLSATFTTYDPDEPYSFSPSEEGWPECGFTHEGPDGEGQKITSEDADDENVINLQVGETAVITISPFAHYQYQGCDHGVNACNPNTCNCWVEGLGCQCYYYPTLRTSDVDITVGDESIVSGALTVFTKDQAVAMTEQGLTAGVYNTLDNTIVLTANEIGTTTVTIDTYLFQWEPVTTTFTINVTEALPRSEHNYANNTDESVTYTLDGAENGVYVTFDERTYTESGYDYVYIYDGDGNLVGRYDGSALAGATVYIQTNTFTIRLTSDESVNYWGYRVVDVSPVGADDIIPLSYGGTLTVPDEVSIYDAPDVTVTIGGKTLVEGQDYTVAWALNTEDGNAPANDNSQIGEYTLTVEGIGSYSGSLSAAFTTYDPDEEYSYIETWPECIFSHGAQEILCEDADDENVITLHVGETVAITITPFAHNQYMGCDHGQWCSPDTCNCWVEGIGCPCGRTPIVRTSDVQISIEDENIVSGGLTVFTKGQEVAMAEQGLVAGVYNTMDNTIILTANAVGTTTVTIHSYLFQWEEADATYTIVVEEAEPAADETDETGETGETEEPGELTDETGELTDETGETTTSAGVQTADESQVVLASVLIAVALLAICGMGYVLRRKNAAR